MLHEKARREDGFGGREGGEERWEGEVRVEEIARGEGSRGGKAVGRGRVAGSRKRGALTRKTGQRDRRQQLALGAHNKREAGETGRGSRGARRMQGMGTREAEDGVGELVGRILALVLVHLLMACPRPGTCAFASASASEQSMILVIHVRDKRQGPTGCSPPQARPALLSLSRTVDCFSSIATLSVLYRPTSSSDPAHIHSSVRLHIPHRCS